MLCKRSVGRKGRILPLFGIVIFVYFSYECSPKGSRRSHSRHFLALSFQLNPLLSGRFFNGYTLNTCICHFRGIGSILSFLFLMENSVRNHVDPYQMPHYVASDLGLHCLHMTFLQVYWVKEESVVEYFI